MVEPTFQPLRLHIPHQVVQHPQIVERMGLACNVLCQRPDEGTRKCNSGKQQRLNRSWPVVDEGNCEHSGIILRGLSGHSSTR